MIRRLALIGIGVLIGIGSVPTAAVQQIRPVITPGFTAQFLPSLVRYQPTADQYEEVRGQIFRVKGDTQTRERIDTGYRLQPAPNGPFMLYLKDSAGANPMQQCVLYDTYVHTPRPVGPRAKGISCFWSPSGRFIVVALGIQDLQTYLFFLPGTTQQIASVQGYQLEWASATHAILTVPFDGFIRPDRVDTARGIVLFSPESQRRTDLFPADTVLDFYFDSPKEGKLPVIRRRYSDAKAIAAEETRFSIPLSQIVK